MRPSDRSDAGPATRRLGPRSLFLALAITTGSAIALPIPATADGRSTCYENLTGYTGTGPPSQDHGPVYEAWANRAADDVRLDRRCRLRGLTVLGGYPGFETADSENVAIFKNKHGLPGRVVHAATVHGIETDGSFEITLDHPIKLKKGRYWVSVQINLFDAASWFWQSSDTVYGAGPVWENPGDGFETGCTTWTPLVTCVPYVEGDLMFSLNT